MDEMYDVVEVRPLKGYRLRLRFADGASGIVDVSSRVPFKRVFAPLRDPEYFRRVRVNADLGTVVWPNGADLDPVVLYCLATGAPVPGEEPAGADAAPRADSRPRSNRSAQGARAPARSRRSQPRSVRSARSTRGPARAGRSRPRQPESP